MKFKDLKVNGEYIHDCIDNPDDFKWIRCRTTERTAKAILVSIDRDSEFLYNKKYIMVCQEDEIITYMFNHDGTYYLYIIKYTGE